MLTSVKPFEQIRANFDISNKDLYISPNSALFKVSREDRIRMKLSKMEKILIQTKSPKGLISKIYILLLYSESSGYDSLKLWEQDLKVHLLLWTGTRSVMEFFLKIYLNFDT